MQQGNLSSASQDISGLHPLMIVIVRSCKISFCSLAFLDCLGGHFQLYPHIWSGELNNITLLIQVYFEQSHIHDPTIYEDLYTFPHAFIILIIIQQH